MQGLDILHILPRVPPAICGVGDYAWGIARQLRDTHGINSSFLSAGLFRGKPSPLAEFPAFHLSDQKADSLINFVKSSHGDAKVVVLHMSCYGYHNKGVPWWLAVAWERLYRLGGRPRMITMFHELAASGPLTTSAFWLNSFQKWVIKRIARASDGLRANRQDAANWLQRQSGLEQAKVVVMPVCSNFGEPCALPAMAERESAMAMFTWPIPPGESLNSLVGKAAGHCHRFGLRQLHLIGGGPISRMLFDGVEVIRYGYLESDVISKLLLSCRMAYTAYDPDFFGRSGLMAGFASHGLVVITRGTVSALPDGLNEGVHVLNESSLNKTIDISSVNLDAMSNYLKGWYDEHSIAKNAQSYATQIEELVNQS